VRRMQDAAQPDQTVLVGAASKGIIQREFQHNAVVYKTPYAKNPFDCVSDQELDDYRHLIEAKARGDESGAEELEVEKMHISAEMAQRQIVDEHQVDGIQSPLSPVTDEEGDTLGHGDDTEAHTSALSHSSKEGSPTKDTSFTDDSMSKGQKKLKKKKGLRTPSFLKMKKDKKKEKEAMHQH